MYRTSILNKLIIMVGTRSTLSLSTSSKDFNDVINNLKTGQVENNGKELRVLLKGSNYAKVLYDKNEELYDLQHAEIPDEYQGKGLGSIFAEKILNHLIAEDKSVKIRLTCEYLQHFYEKNQMKYKDNIEE